MMSSAALKRKLTLSGRLFSSSIALVLGVTLTFAFAMVVALYISYEQNAEERLVAEAESSAEALDALPDDAARIAVMSAQMNSDIRFTLIASNGDVRFDSLHAEGLENHGDRPEVMEAEADGKAISDRYSSTLGTDMIYAAVRLENGDIIRLAQSRDSLFAFLGELVGPMLLGIVLLVVVVLAFSRFVSERILKPIDALDFTDPTDNEIYEEMRPLLSRISEQQVQLKRQNNELARAENMRREFSANVSHEMKTPLTVISGYAELMMNGMTKQEDTAKFSGLIYEEAQVMRSLINDVLVISRLEEEGVDKRHSSGPIDLSDVVKRVVRRLEKVATDGGVEVRTALYAECYIDGIETLAEEMVYNLVENGIRYNHPGGNVTVAVSVEGDSACLMVKDTGTGIPEDLQDKVFERFFRVEKSRSKDTGGTGLGLAIVKHAVQYLNGSIRMVSREGEGTTFTLAFPRV